MSPPYPVGRFWQSVYKDTTERGCWIWLEAKTRKGYGICGAVNGQRQAHRIAWTLRYGPIPDRLHVCHRCDTPLCVNPDHLFLGTAFDNLGDAAAKGRTMHGERHVDAKLKDDDVLTIRARHSAGEPVNAITSDYPVSRSQVQRIVAGKNWKHLLAARKGEGV